MFACAGFVALALLTRRESEPSYQGKPLSAWLRRATIFNCQVQLPEENIQAIQRIGTNALPFLLQWLQYEPSAFRLSVYRVGDRWHLPVQWLVRTPRAYLRDEAMAGFWVLGPAARPAVSVLGSLLDSTNLHVQACALTALCGIGKDALPPILDVLTNAAAHPNSDRILIEGTFTDLTTNAFLMVPSLIPHVASRDPKVAASSAFILGNLALMQERMGLPPEQTADIVPTLCANIAATNPEVRYQVVMALSHFGPRARPAVPLILQALHDSRATVRQAAREALKQIEPSALNNIQEP